MRNTSTLLPTLALGLSLAAAASAQGERNAIAFFPLRAEANAAIAPLTVQSYRWNCGHTFTDKTAARNGSRIDVRFAVHENPTAICPAVDRPYGFEIGVNGMPEGRYEVWATPLIPCQVLPNPCERAEIPERMGVLTVGKPREGDWFALPGSVKAEQAFDLRILNHRYGSCHDRFRHAASHVSEGVIHATFTVERDTGHVCITDEFPSGPTFKLAGLKAGRYPVSVTLMPACAYFPQPCPMIPPIARVIDTVHVGSMGATRIGGMSLAPRASGARISFTGRFLRVTLPESQTPWRADAARRVDPVGRRVP